LPKISDISLSVVFSLPPKKRVVSQLPTMVSALSLSRLGRDHLKVGHFTEIYFPMKNVRYIAVNDCVDTAKKQRHCRTEERDE
jgi:hypothetical protein